MSTVRTSAFSPGHITGFFQICDSDDSPVRKGSRGAGISCSAGVRTVFEWERSKNGAGISVTINGQPEENAVVSCRVMEIIRSEFKIAGEFSCRIFHTIEVPMGSGYGSSGAGALSLSIAVNRALDLGLTREQAAVIAHRAEVDCKTGLGTVIGETYGGIEIRVEPGAPGTGRILRIKPEREHTIITVNYGPLSTRSYLSDRDARQKINRTGGELVEKLKREQTIAAFMRYSREFAEKTGLITEKIRPLLDAMDGRQIPASMPIFGEGIFTVVPSDIADETAEFMGRHAGQGGLFKWQIDDKGAQSDDN
jgi:pantoate kinase